MSSKKDTYSRGWCFTINNYTAEDETRLAKIDCAYMIYGKEVGEKCGTPHLQGFVYFKNARGFNSMRKQIGGHLSVAKGNGDQNKSYCSKDGDFVERGVPPTQGKRGDIESLVGDILKGESSIDKIVETAPGSYQRFGRTLERAEELRMARNVGVRDMPAVIWYYGPTGIGKSHEAFEGFSADTHYCWKDDKGWWDNYKQQDTCIINEFRGQISYSELLSLCDKWPTSVRRRGRCPVPFTSKRIIITSCEPPAGVFKNLSERDTLDQLYRRCVIMTRDTVDEPWMTCNFS